jgi:hypothetical protein
MPESKKETVDVNQFLKSATDSISASSSAPPPVTATPEAPALDAQFRDSKTGRWLYKYEVNGETIVLPKPIDQMSEQDFYDLPITLYESHPGRIPQNLTVTFKDPHWAGYWFNKSAKQAMRVATGRALGFIPAKKEDLEWYCLELSDADGAVEQHDIVLMKIHKAKLYLKYKEAIDLAKIKGGIAGYKQQAESFAQQAGVDIQNAPYYHTKQAEQEFQGLGPVKNYPTVG